MLVLLRVVVGLHFFTQGSKHLGDRNWSSAGFFRAAKGPLAGLYHGLVPDTSDGWDATVGTPLKSEPKTAEPGTQERAEQDAKVFAEWQEKIALDWASLREQISQNYSFDEAQNEQANQRYIVYVDKLAKYLSENQEDIEAYRHDLYRLEQMSDAEPADEVPYGAERIAYLRSKTAGQRATHLGWFKKTARDYETELLALRNGEQIRQGDMPDTRATIDTIDAATTWMIILVGACLTLGLFSRCAAFVGGMFLLSVVLSQPLSGVLSTPQAMAGGTYPQFLEMMALFVLAAVPAGKWCGLDSFLSRCCGGDGEAKAK
ncbi:MAG: DoxX family protein [Pirellulales bacterium]|nr:DoxX family protein [Pirellulales bacterium]